MPIEYEVLPYLEWLLPSPGERFGALIQFIASFAVLGLICLLAWYLVAAIRQGPSEGFYAVAKVVYNAFADDLPKFSFRRTYAMMRLAIQESIRKRVIVGFIVFVVLLLFAGWFLDTNSPNPGRLYLGFVLTTVKYLLLALALFLSAFSLPTDIKNRTIYTIVTKPVRSGEIILGRVLGFASVGTALLLMMGATSYFFVIRGLNHTHSIASEEMVPSGSGKSAAAKGRTSFDAYHRHEVTVGDDGVGQTDIQAGHWHPVTVDGAGDSKKYVVGPHQGMLTVRVPIYGQLRFTDRNGAPKATGVSVGDEWTYRSYIEGKTQATAIWTFRGVTEERFPDGLPLEINLGVFRTHKGDIERTVLGELILVNPNERAKVRRSEVIPFSSREFEPLEMRVSRERNGVDARGKLIPVDLFRDLADEEGNLEVHIRCAEGAQYFGMAQADVFLRAKDGSFVVNFAKAHVSIWLQMLMTISLGVMFSTFLTGPVAMLGTAASLVLGFFREFVLNVFDGVFQGPDALKRFVRDLFAIREEAGVPGGGPIEAFIRMVRQLNLTGDLELGAAQKPVEYFDVGFMLVIRLFTQMLPDFTRFDSSSYVAYGFNVDSNLLGAQITTAFAFVFVTSVVGYLFLKTRELAA